MKKLSLEELNVLYADVCNTLIHTEQRRGQALFNCLYVSHPELADSLRGTYMDCFYINNRVRMFLISICENIEELENSDWKTILPQSGQ